MVADLAGADLLHAGVLLVIPGDVAEAGVDDLVGFELRPHQGSSEANGDQYQDSSE